LLTRIRRERLETLDLALEQRIVLLLELVLVVLHFDHLDDVFQRGRPAGVDVLRLTNRRDGEVEAAPFLLEQRSLRREHPLELARRRPEEPLDVPEWNADELQRDDLLKHRHVAVDIESIARHGSARPEQPETVVVVQRPDADAGQRRELVDAIGPLTVGRHLR
jgi:hypothetical protein